MNPPIVIVTGFLGSGKTTLLRKLIAGELADRRVGLIVNEFGRPGFDGRLLSEAGPRAMLELAGGCICCTAGSDLILAVEDLLATIEPDLVLVEASGVAAPGPLVRRLVEAELGYDSIVTVVDGANLPAALETSPLAGWQIAAADLLVLNKCDLIDEPMRAERQASLRMLNRRALILPAVHGAVAFGPLLGAPRLPRPIDAADGEQHHLAAEGLAAISWTGDLPLDHGRFTATLSDLQPSVYRAKGLVHCTDAPWTLAVNLVFGRYNDEPIRLATPSPHLNELVLIGPGLEQMADTITARLDACVDTPERVARWRAAER